MHRETSSKEPKSTAFSKFDCRVNFEKREKKRQLKNGVFCITSIEMEGKAEENCRTHEINHFYLISLLLG